MRRAGLLVLVGALAGTSLSAHDQVPGKPQAGPVLLRGGDLYTVSDGVLRGSDLLFDGGLILRLGKDLEAPDRVASTVLEWLA